MPLTLRQREANLACVDEFILRDMVELVMARTLWCSGDTRGWVPEHYAFYPRWGRGRRTFLPEHAP